MVSLLTRVTWLIVGLAVAGVLLLAFGREGLKAEAQAGKARAVQWTVTAVMQHQVGGGALGTMRQVAIYRVEDPEYKIVCYTQHEDFSGSFSCVKR
jgi:hypothetical protein